MGYHAEKNHGIAIVEYVLQHYNDFNTILEVGCSNGKNVSHLNAIGKQARGFDISLVAVANANNPNCYVASVVAIPEKDSCVDAIFSSDVLEHLHESELEKAVSELVRVTSKYLFVKICPGKEKNTGWIKLLHSFGKFKELDCLHTIVKPIEFWLVEFLKTGELELLENYKNLLIFRKRNR